MADNRINVQDWEPVVFRKRPAPKRGPTPSTSRAVTNDYDPETVTAPKTSNRSMGLSIQQGRQAKGMKQTDLDSTCNLPRGTTSSYESGKAVYKPNEVNKMARALGITIPRPGKSGSKGRGKKK